MTPAELQKLSSNERFLLRELERRGASARPLDLERGWLEVRLGGRTCRLVEISGPDSGLSDTVVASHKHLTKQLLAEAGLSVPRGGMFGAATLDDAFAFAQDLPPPWVLKPCFGTHGAGVHTGLQTLIELREALTALHAELGPEVPFLIEEQARGVEHRVFITRRGDAAVTRREAAHVMGDGRSTLRKLVYAESDRRTFPKRLGAECPIPLDAVALAFLAKQGLTPEHVVEAGRKVWLRGNSNLKTGGTCTDATDAAHDSVLELAARVLEVFPHAPVIGIDLMLRDVAAPQTPDAYCLIEVNTVPGMGMHLAPGRGEARDVAAAVADVLFPETAKLPPSPRPRRLPACRIAPLE